MKTLDDALAPGKISGKRYTDWISGCGPPFAAFCLLRHTDLW